MKCLETSVYNEMYGYRKELMENHTRISQFICSYDVPYLLCIKNTVQYAKDIYSAALVSVRSQV